MAKVILYREKRDGNILLQFTHNLQHSRAYTGIKVRACEWDSTRRMVVGLLNKNDLNTRLYVLLTSAQEIIARLQWDEGIKDWSSAKLRDRVMAEMWHTQEDHHRFVDVMAEFMKTCKTKGTRDIYLTTYRKVCEFDRDATFESITPQWLEKFKETMRGCSVNYINIQLRNIRAVFNFAIDQELTTAYPFRKVKIKNEATAMRDLTTQQLHDLMSADVPAWCRKYIDLFMLQFYLIGISIKDIFNLGAHAADSGRICYRRAKTGRLYDIKVESEAEAIISRYKGDVHLLSMFDTYRDHRDFLKRYNDGLQYAAKAAGLPADLTSYWCRYTWASIAYNHCDISMEDISAALGHSYGMRVTNTYINRDLRKIDAANRKVIDFVCQ